MLSAELEPTIFASERPQPHALDRPTTGIDRVGYYYYRYHYYFLNMPNFFGEELLAPFQNIKLEAHPLSAFHDCLFNTFAPTIHAGGITIIIIIIFIIIIIIIIGPLTICEVNTYTEMELALCE